jgi:prophage antirepressor-like protein
MAPISIHVIRSITESYRVTVWLRKGLRRSTRSLSESNFYTLIVPSGAGRPGGNAT